MRRTPPLIVGGGPAGSAAALALAHAGVRACVIERQREFGDAICGGFVSWRTLHALRQLGITPPGHPVTRVRLFSGGRSADAPLPAGAVGLSRRVLDTLMLQAARDAGAAVEHDQVREVTEGAVRIGTHVEPTATLFLASGKYDVRGTPRPRPPGDPTLGLRVRLPASPHLLRLLGDAIELHLFDRGYAGIVLQEDGSANVCLAVRKSRLTEAGGDPEALLRALGGEALGERLAFMPGGLPADAIAAVPYGWRARETEPRLYRLGDQAACIPSLAGEGIGIAVASGIAAAQAWTKGVAAERFQRAFAARTARPVTTARLLWQAAERPSLAPLAVAALSRAPWLATLGAVLTRVRD